MMSKVLSLHSPLSVCLWVNSLCNLDCQYCYAKPFTNRQMDYKRLSELIDEIISMRVFDLTLAGGEPLLYPQIVDILKKITSHEMTTAILTNCVRLPDKFLSLFDSPDIRKKLMVQVSIDSIDSAQNDITRGKTTDVVRNLELLIEHGATVQLATVITTVNINQAHTIIDAFYPKVKRFVFHVIQKTSASLAHPELFPDPEALRTFWVDLQKYAEKFPNDLQIPSLSSRTKGVFELDQYAEFNTKATFSPSACSAGHVKAEIDANFNVIGCDVAKAHTIIGNVRDTTLSQVWNSPEADALRETSFLPCRKNRIDEVVAVPISFDVGFTKSING